MKRDGWRNLDDDNRAKNALPMRVAISWTWLSPEHLGTWHSVSRPVSTLAERIREI
jgi:hypothetical protein